MQAAAPTVLVADDDSRLLRIMRLFLETQGYAVETAADGEEAIALVRRVVPSLVILDVMMPGIDGLTACRFLKSDPATAHIPVLIYSAMTTAKREAPAAGADGVITKPFSLPSLGAAIRSFLAAPAAVRPATA